MFGNIGPGFSHDRRIVYFLSDSSSSGDWYDVNWSNRIESEINATYVDEGIPVIPVFLNNIDTSSSFWTNVNNDGSDIRVTAIDGTSELPYYVVNFDATSNIGILFVNVSSIIDTVNGGKFYIYYGNDGAVTTSDSEAVFANTGYEAYYLPGMTTKNLVNQSLYELTAVNSPGTAASNWAGLTAATYSTSRHTASSSPVSDWPLTIDHLTLYSSLASPRVAMGIGNTSGGANNYVYTYTSGSALQSYVKGASGSFASTNISSAVAVDTWYALALSRDANTGTSAAYIDNTSATNTTTITTPSFNGLSIGSEYDNSIGIHHAGSVAQAAVSSVVRSANFVATNYDAWFQSDFITFDTNNIQNKP